MSKGDPDPGAGGQNSMYKGFVAGVFSGISKLAGESISAVRPCTDRSQWAIRE